MEFIIYKIQRTNKKLESPDYSGKIAPDENLIIIKTGKHENCIDLNGIHFKTYKEVIYEMYREVVYEKYKEALIYYSIKDKDFDINNSYIIFGKESYPIQLGNNNLTEFHTEKHIFTLFYELKPIKDENSSDYSNMKIKKHEMPSFFVKERSEEIPKVDF